MARLSGNFDKAKLVIKDLSNPRNPPEDGTPKYLGRIGGICTGTKAVADARGETFTALVGNFAGISPADKDGNQQEIRSGVAYLPGGFHDSVISALKAAGEAGQVRFAYDCYSVFADNPIGYAYVFKPLLKPERASDPLAEIMGTAAPQIAAPAAEPAKGKHTAA